MNLETLRLARMRRMGVKVVGYLGQRRIFFLLDRATKKFPGDVPLWIQYIEYARKRKAYNRLTQILSTVLRLHPSNPQLWIHAANYALIDREDITEARSYLQRGLRFRRKSKELWIEFARLEMVYITQLRNRTRILGVDENDSKKVQSEKGEETQDLMLLPTEASSNFAPDPADVQALETLGSTPAMSGAIPKAIYNSACTEFPKDVQLSAQFYDLFAEWRDLPCSTHLCQYVLKDLGQNYADSPETWSCRVRLPFIGIDPTGAEFASALLGLVGSDDPPQNDAASLGTYSKRAISDQNTATFTLRTMSWMAPYMLMNDIDDACMRVVRQTIKRLWDQYRTCVQEDSHTTGPSHLDRIADIIRDCGLEQ